MATERAIDFDNLLLVVGLLTALATSQVLAALLFGISPRDPLTYGAVSGVLLGMGGGIWWWRGSISTPTPWVCAAISAICPRTCPSTRN